MTSIKLNPTSPPEANREPDNGIYAPETGSFYIGDRGDRSVPGSKGSIEIVDTRSGTYVASITVDDSDPAGLALDPGTSKMYVALGMTSRVAVIDRKKREVLTTCQSLGASAPCPGIGCRSPATVHRKPDKERTHLQAREDGHHGCQNGKFIDAVDSEGGVDEAVYEPSNQRVYFTGTTGGIDVFEQLDSDHYRRLRLVPTGALAKTSLFVPNCSGSSQPFRST